MIIQIHVFELLLSLVCVVVVWLGLEVCVVVVVVVVEEVLPDVCGCAPELELFWANTGTAIKARLRMSRHALKLSNNRQDFIICNSPFLFSSKFSNQGAAHA